MPETSLQYAKTKHVSHRSFAGVIFNIFIPSLASFLKREREIRTPKQPEKAFLQLSGMHNIWSRFCCCFSVSWVGGIFFGVQRELFVSWFLWGFSISSARNLKTVYAQIVLSFNKFLSHSW